MKKNIIKGTLVLTLFITLFISYGCTTSYASGLTGTKILNSYNYYNSVTNNNANTNNKELSSRNNPMKSNDNTKHSDDVNIIFYIVVGLFFIGLLIFVIISAIPNDDNY